MADYSKDYVKIMKDNKVVVVGTQGQTDKIGITGLGDGVDVAAGTYQVVVDEDNKTDLSANASDPVDVPAFKTAAAAPVTPTAGPQVGTAVVGQDKLAEQQQ